MAANTAAFTYAELRRAIGREIGVPRDPTSPAWSTIQSQDVADILKRGQHAVYWPRLPEGAYSWSFLKPTLAQLTLRAPYSTGTVGVTSTTVTLSGGTWPTWAAAGELFVNDEWLTVASRGSGTSLTLDAAPSATISAGTSYQLICREYALPDDFGGMATPQGFSYRRDQDWGPKISLVNESMIRNADQSSNVSGPPAYAAIVPVAPTTSTDLRWNAIFDCLPDQDYPLWYRYSVIPAIIDATNVYAYVPAYLHDTLVAACVDVALQTLYQDFSKHGAFQESLRGAIQIDRQMNRAETLGFGAYSDGYERNGSYFDRDAARRNATLTFNVT